MACIDYSYVDSVPGRLVCSICFKVMRDPHLIVCCGAKCCHSCLQNWLGAKPLQSCPHCCATKESQDPFQHVVDKGAKAEIDCLKIRCSNSIKGCGWVGKIKDLAAHLELASSDCECSWVECPNQCRSGVSSCTKVPQRNLTDHLKNYCELRFVICEYCGREGVAKDDAGHKRSCKFLPVECPNRCGCDQGLVRETIEAHLRICTLEYTPCEYADVGCVAVMRRRDKLQHTLDFQGEHLELATSAFRKLQSEVQQRRKVVNHELKLLTKSVHDRGGDQTIDFCLASLITQFKRPLEITEKSLVLRMLNLSKIKNCHKEWVSPELQLEAFTIYFIVKGCD